MTQEEINEQFILTLDSEQQLYYTTILIEAESNLGLKPGGQKERDDPDFVKKRYDMIVEKKEQVPQLKQAFGLFNFEEQRSLALVNSIVKLISQIELKAKIAESLAT